MRFDSYIYDFVVLFLFHTLFSVIVYTFRFQFVLVIRKLVHYKNAVL